MTQPDDLPVATQQAPAVPRRSPDRRRRVGGFAILGVAGVLALVWGYFVWLRATAPALPNPDLSLVEPMVADAIRSARNLVAEHIRAPHAWGELGLVLHAHDFFDTARECYSHAERFEPASPVWPYLHGDSLTREGNLIDAIPHFRRAAERSNRDTTIRLRLAEALFEYGQVEEAKHGFLEVEAEFPVEPRAQLGLARVALAGGDARAGVAHLQKCLARTGDIRIACRLLAQAYHSLDEQDLAADALRRAEKQSESHAWADMYTDLIVLRMTGSLGLGKRATALYRSGRAAEGQKLLEELVHRYPDSAVARGGLGRFLVLRDQPAAAEPHLRQALGMDSKLVDVRHYLATALLRQKMYAEAAGEFQQVLDRQPSNGDARLRLALCLHALGDKPGAVRALQDAVRYEPQNLTARKSLGALHLELGQYAECVAQLELAGAIDPSDNEIPSLLDRARQMLKQADE